MTWFPLRVRSTYSLLKGIMTPNQIADRCVELGLPGCALVDEGTLAAAIDFVAAMEKNNLKWILGCEFNYKTSESIIVYAKNLHGWNSLMELLSISNNYERIENFGNPTVVEHDLTNLKSENNIILLLSQAQPYILHPSYYASRQDAADQRVVLCSELNTTLKKIHKIFEKSPNHKFKDFFDNQDYFIYSEQEAIDKYGIELLNKNLEIANQCESYKITRDPILPKFNCPGGISSIDYLKQLARHGWQTKIVPHIPQSQHQKYINRIKDELAIIEEANISGYFLIIADVIQEFRKRGYLLGSGRGSIGGSLIAYLIGLTSIDSIAYDLSFSRFYNRGRCVPGHISLPDIDTDFPKCAREEVVTYLKEKYGEDCVTHISTYGGMKGRGALKDVLRAHEACDFSEMNKITEEIPDPAKIADQLQELEEQGEDCTIIDWALNNKAEKLKEWCWKDENGRLQGKFAKLFEQAIRLEGTKRNRGKHAAGIIISPFPLRKICPMVYDRDSNESICGMEFDNAEAMGLVKMDILGITLLDKLMDINKLLQEKDLNEI